MPKIKHILFPFDFSKQASLVVPFVGTMASRYGAKISVLSVIPPAWDGLPQGLPPLPGLNAPEEELRACMAQALAQEFAGLETCHVAQLGDPARKIVEFAHKEGVDLIMMPTHGVSGYSRELLGSLTAKVLHEAKCPIWTATHAEEQQPSTAPRTVVCAIDDSVQTGALMQWASEFSQQMGADLRFVHAVPPVSDALALPSEGNLQEEMCQGARAKLEAVQQSAGIKAPLQVVVGRVAEAVTEEARQQGADLILMGRGLLRSPLGRLRSNAYAMIQLSPCPVVSV